MARASHTPFLLLVALALALVVSPTTGRRSRQKQMPGGVEAADPNSEEVQQVLDFAVNFYNQGNSDPNLSLPVRVMSAHQQVVGGMNYYLKVEMGRTTCTKSQSNLSNCPFSEQRDQQKREICSFQIYTVPWQQEMSVTNYSCHSA